MEKSQAGFNVKNAITVLLALGFIAFLYFLSLKSETDKIPPKPVTVGWIGSLSGTTSALGIDNLNAIKLALKEYQANKTAKDPDILLLSENDNYNVNTALTKYHQMLAEFPVAIFFGSYSSIKQAAPSAIKDDVLIISSIDNDKQIASLNPYVFLIAKETEALAGTIANAIIDQGKKNIAVIFYGEDQDFLVNLANFIKEILTRNAIKTTMIDYKRGVVDFQEILKSTKAEDIDGYVFFGYQEIGFAMKQAREMGITAPFYSVNVITDPVLQKNSEGAVSGTYFAHFTSLDGNRVETDEFINRYYQEYHKKPLLEWTAMQGYDAANILFSAIKRASHENGNFVENVRQQLLETSNYEGVSGNISILPSGASRGIYPRLYILENGEAVPAE